MFLRCTGALGTGILVFFFEDHRVLVPLPGVVFKEW
jgi:hypothetical protein